MDKLTRIKTFVRVAERSSFSAVARELAVTQPAVSKAVAALESELGVRLVNRNTRSVALTEAGQRYYERCRDILADLDDADAMLKERTAGFDGLLRVAAPVPFGLMFVSPLVARFCEMNPALAVSLDLCDEYQNLVEENIDVAIRLGRLDAPGTVASKLGESPFVAVASPAYIAARGAPATPQALAGHHCLVYSSKTAPLQWQFEGSAPVRVHSRYCSNNLLVLKEAALAGNGIARLPLWMVSAEMAGGSLVRVLENARLPAFGIHAVFPSARRIPARVGAFVDFVRKAFSQTAHFQPVPFAVGDVVRLVSVGEWLLKDLLPAEQMGILSCVGELMTITEIDPWGSIWVGFGRTMEDGEDARYVGQWFIVEPDRIELVSTESRRSTPR